MKTLDAVSISPAELPIVQTLSAVGRRALLASAAIETYRRGEQIFRQGERAKGMWIVLEGWVHLLRASEQTPRMRPVLIFTVTPDEALCGVSAIDSGVYNVSAVAASSCRVLRLSGDAFHDALTTEPAFAYQVLRLCARRMRHIAEQYGTMAEPALHRIIRSMLRLRQQFGWTLPVTHKELAQMSWTTTETAIRVIRALKRQQYVRGTRGRVTISRSKSIESLLASPTPHKFLASPNGASHA